MENIMIAGIPAQSYGSNNYSFGMEAIIFNPKDVTLDMVKTLPNVFLHPTCEPNSLEIFCLLGTTEQFASFYNDVKVCTASKKAINKFGMPTYTDREAWNKIHAYEEELVASFKAWYE